MPFTFRPSPFAFSSVYDHDGIRVGKTINGTDIFKYMVDKNRPYAQVLEEQWSNGALSATTGYVYGDALISRTTNGTTHFYHYDGMGSTRTLTDATGAVTDTYLYDAYGNLLDKTGSTINPYSYRSEQYDDDLSAYYLRARYYQPEIGRFLTTDHVEGFPNNPITLHRYMYGSCDPVNYVDPSGESSLSEQLTTAGIVGILNAAAMVGSYTETGRTIYAWLGEHFFPDAMVLGAMGSFDLINTIASFFNVQLPMSYFYGRYYDIPTSGGIEILMSVSSGQVTAFLIGGGMVGPTFIDFGSRRCRPIINGALYRAYVWNLWNSDDYAGWFMTVGSDYSNGKSGYRGKSFGYGLFWDLKRWFGGPWGISRTIWSKNFSFRKDLKHFSLGAGVTAYHEPLPFELNFTNEYAVLPFIMLAIGIDHYINATRSVGKLLLPTKQLALLLGETSFWFQLTVAKRRWNEISEHDVNTRQMTKRPIDFHSGPHLPGF